MTNPDDIAIALAGEVYDASNPGSDVPTEVRLFTKLMMARAIMAEREACARVADERVPLWEEVEAVAAAIRNRGKGVGNAEGQSRFLDDEGYEVWSLRTKPPHP